MREEQLVLKILDSKGNLSEASAELFFDKLHTLRITHPVFGTKTSDSSDYFNCLCEIRKQIEPNGFRIVCNGSRRDTYPSGMCRDMGQGLKVYLMTLGVKAKSTDLVSTFDDAPLASIGSVKEQEDFHNRWMKSLESANAQTRQSPSSKTR